MSGIRLLVASADVVVGLLCVVLAIPLVLRRVPMNPWYGARFPESFKSDEAWYRINTYSGKRLVFWGACIAVIGACGLAFPLETRPWLTVLFALVPLLVVIAAIESWRYARRVDREITARQGRKAE